MVGCDFYMMSSGSYCVIVLCASVAPSWDDVRSSGVVRDSIGHAGINK